MRLRGATGGLRHVAEGCYGQTGCAMGSGFTVRQPRVEDLLFLQVQLGTIDSGKP